MLFFSPAMPSTLLFGVLLGVSFGALYDVLRILRVARALRHASAPLYGQRMAPCPLHTYLEKKRKKHARPPIWELVLLFLEDFFFCISFACAIAVLVFATHDGVLRWYPFAACAVGFFGYRLTLGRLVMRSATAILSFCRRVLVWTVRRTLVPIRRCLRRWLGAVLARIARLVGRLTTRRYAKRLPARMMPPAQFAAAKKRGSRR